MKEQDYIGIEAIFTIANQKPYELYRFVIDGNKQGIATSIPNVDRWEDKERGSLQGVLNGFKLIIDRIKTDKENFKPDSSFLKLIHATCTKGVERLNKGAHGEFALASTPYYGRGASGERREYILNHPRGHDYFSSNSYTVSHSGFRVTPREKTLEPRADLIFNNYNENIAKPNLSDEEKIGYIVECIQELEWLHPFSDANCRSICVLLLNSLLLSQNMMPVILDDPNNFDCYTKNELIEDVKNGQKNVSLLLKEKINVNEFSFNKDNKEILFLTENEVPVEIKESNLYFYCHGDDDSVAIAEDNLDQLKNKGKLSFDDFILATKHDSLNVVKYFLEKTAVDLASNANIMSVAIHSNSEKVLQYFFANHFYLLSKPDEHGRLPLDIVIEKENTLFLKNALDCVKQNEQKIPIKTCLPKDETVFTLALKRENYSGSNNLMSSLITNRNDIQFELVDISLAVKYYEHSLVNTLLSKINNLRLDLLLMNCMEYIVEKNGEPQIIWQYMIIIDKILEHKPYEYFNETYNNMEEIYDPIVKMLIEPEISEPAQYIMQNLPALYAHLENFFLDHKHKELRNEFLKYNFITHRNYCIFPYEFSFMKDSDWQEIFNDPNQKELQYGIVNKSLDDQYKMIKLVKTGCIDANYIINGESLRSLAKEKNYIQLYNLLFENNIYNKNTFFQPKNESVNEKENAIEKKYN